MRKHSKLLLTALSAALVLAAVVGTANARRFQITEQAFRVVWPNEARLTFNGFGGLISVNCPVTLEGTFHSRTLSKVSGQLIGFVTRAQLTRPCGGSGEAWILNGIERIGAVTTPNTLPWHIRYDRFIGALPSITGIRVQLIDASFLLEAAGETCLYRSTAALPAYGIIERNAAAEITGLRADEASEIPKLAGGAFCPARGSFRGSGNVTVLGTTTRIFVRLVQ